MKSSFKYILIFAICLFGFVNTYLADSSDAYCQIGGANGIKIGEINNVKLYAKVISDGNIELYNCDPYADENCIPFKKNDVYNCKEYLDGSCTPYETIYNGVTYYNLSSSFSLDSNTIKYFTAESCPSVWVDEENTVMDYVLLQKNYVLRFAENGTGGLYEDSYTTKPVSKKEIDKNIDLNDDNYNYCNYGTKNELKIGNVTASLFVKIKDNSTFEIYNNCSGNDCNGISLKKGGAPIKCLSYFDNECSLHSIVGQVSYPSDSISSSYPGYLKTIEKDDHGHYRCPYIKVRSDNDDFFGVYLAEKGTEGAVPPDTEYSTSKKESKEISEEGTQKIIDSFVPQQIISKEVGKCTDYLGSADKENTTAHFIDNIYDFVKIGAVIVMIILSMIDFAGTITKSNDELMETVKKNGKRIIVLLILILLPTFIDILGNLFGVTDILCGIK